MRRLLIMLILMMLTACGGSAQSPASLTTEPATLELNNLPTREVATLQPTLDPASGNSSGNGLLDLPTNLPAGVATPDTSDASPTPLPASAKTFVIPAPARESVNYIQLCDTATMETKGVYDLDKEVQCLFETFYQARGMDRGGSIDVAKFRSLVDGAYADYTMPLVNADVERAARGELLESHYTNISTNVLEKQEAPNGADRYIVEVTRTRTNTTPAGEESNTLTLKFRANRIWMGGLMSGWYIDDFFNPASNNWVSATIPLSTAQLQPEVESFFKEFYAARSVELNQRIDLQKTVDLTNFAYRPYALALLQSQAQQVESGEITSINYSEIKVEVLDYDPVASNHGGLATVKVTRTQNIHYPNGNINATTITNQFRIHRHFDEKGAGRWYAVDFFQPDAQRWVSEIAGEPVPLPQGAFG